MARKVGRVKQEEMKRRVLELETLIGQKALAKKLHVSTDSIRRYREGKTAPQTKAIYNKINNLYSRNKKEIKNEFIQKAVEIRKAQILKRSKAQEEGRLKNRYVPIYPDYMHYGAAREFQDTPMFNEVFQGLSEQGYVAGYRGRNDIPLECQFVIHGEDLNRFGLRLNVIGIASKDYKFGDGLAMVKKFQMAYFQVEGLKKTMPFNERMDRIRETFLSGGITKNGKAYVFLGFYFDEGDEM